MGRGHGCVYRLDDRGWRERVVVGPGDKGRFVEGLVDRKDGMSSCDAITGRVGVGGRIEYRLGERRRR